LKVQERGNHIIHFNLIIFLSEMGEKLVYYALACNDIMPTDYHFTFLETEKGQNSHSKDLLNLEATFEYMPES
jgi:hypothetical protein